MTAVLTQRYRIVPMTAADIDEVLAIERATFRFPWSRQAFSSELALPYTVWRVVRIAVQTGGRLEWDPPAGPDAAMRPRSQQACGGLLVGYSGFQAILGEGHIMNVAVHADYRRQGIGELLLQDLYDWARSHSVVRFTLEVRASNLAALGLYQKYGFQVEGRRLRYYGDGEDALIMWTGRLDLPEVQERWVELRRQLYERIGTAIR